MSTLKSSGQLSQAIKIPAEVIGAFGEIVISPKLWAYLLPQYIVGLGSGYLIFTVLWEILFPIFSNYFTFELTNWPGFIISVISWLGGGLAYLATLIISGLGSVIGAYTAIMVLTGFFVELFIEQALRKRGQTPFHSPSFVNSLMRILKDESRKLILFTILGVIIIITAFIPLLTPISFLLGSLLLGFEIFDLPLTLIGLRFTERFKIIRQHFLPVLTLGALGSLVAIIPFLPILLLPIGYLAALRSAINWREVKDFYSSKSSSSNGIGIHSRS